MRRSTLRTAVAVVTAALTLTACGSDDGGSDDSGSGADAATATSAEDFGGMDALIEAARRRARSTSSRCRRTGRTTARCWTPSARSTTSRSTSANPDGSSQDELNAVESQKGQDRAPDVLDLGTAFARQAQAQDLLAPYQVATWDEIPEDQKDPDGHWVNDYGGYISIGCNASVIAECPTSFEALLDPQYAGQVALNGNPTQAAAAFSGVWAASLANGGSLDDIGPGIDFFAQIKDAGNFNPVEITPATIQSGETPLADRLGLPQRLLHRDVRRGGRRVGGERPERRALRRLLQPGDQQVRAAPGGGAALAGVPLQRRGPEHLAEGRRPAGPAARDGGGRHRRRGRLWRRCPQVEGTADFPTQEQESAAQAVVAERWNAEISG